MADSVDYEAIRAYWGREGLGDRIISVLRGLGKDLDALTIDDLAPLDQFHGGGKPATDRLARIAAFEPGTRVLDVGGGLGGPARTLAVQHGCTVDVLDLTESYIEAGRMLTERLGLDGQVRFHLGNALDLPFEDASFDAVWTQNSGMNIADKARLYAGFHRVIRPGGRLIFQEPLAGPVQPIIYPLMWSHDGSASFLLTPDEMQRKLESAGFRRAVWDDVTADTSKVVTPAPGTAPTLQMLVMADAVPQISKNQSQNIAEGRFIYVHAMFDRI